MANKDKNILNTPTTVFDIGSVTKQFTGAAILKLVEFKKLKVTDPLRKFFKSLPDDKKDITVHQLLTHSAGLLDVIGEGDFDHITTAMFFNKLFATKLLHKPGSKHEYSNSGYSILARIIELVSGQDYEDFLDQHLFKPAGMKYTGYLKPKWDSELFANGYKYGVMNIGSMATRYRKEGKISWVLKGNGGINSTQEDMFKWYKALKTNKVLSKSQIKVFTTPYIRENDAGSSHYAYGWAIFNTKRNTKMVTHNGSNGIFFHDFIWLPEEDIVIIYSTNAYNRQVGGIAWRIGKMIFDASYIPKNITVDLMSSLFRYTLDYEGNTNELTNKIKEKFGKDINKTFYLNRLGNVFLNENKVTRALALFTLNLELFPDKGNLWDSLGEGYLINNQQKLAKSSFKKALELKPDTNCYWCKNSSKRLKQLSTE